MLDISTEMITGLLGGGALATVATLFATRKKTLAEGDKIRADAGSVWMQAYLSIVSPLEEQNKRQAEQIATGQAERKIMREQHEAEMIALRRESAAQAVAMSLLKDAHEHCERRTARMQEQIEALHKEVRSTGERPGERSGAAAAGEAAPAS